MDINVAQDGPHIVVSVSGEVDAHNCAEIGKAVSAAGAVDPTPVVIDAAELSFIDSSAISELLRIRQDLADQGSELTIRNVGSNVRRVLEMTGLLETFGVD